MEDAHAKFLEVITIEDADAEDSENVKSLTPQTISVVRTVLDKCKKEYEKNELDVPLEQFVARASYYTNYPPAIFSQLEDFSEEDDKPFDVPERIAIIKSLYDFYIREKAPKYSDVYLKLSIQTSSFYQFRKKMLEFGFFYLPTKTDYILTEDPKIRFERFKFLNKIKKFRTCQTPIYYVDERVIDYKLNFQKPQIFDGKETLLADGNYLILHAMSAKKVKHSFLSNIVSCEVFKKWITDVLLKTLTKDCVIILDGHEIQGKLTSNEITRYHTKEDMLEYLRANNIPCNGDMHKAELYDLSQKLTRKESFYSLDKLLKAFGYEVLRVPFGCSKLSITELLWDHVRATLEEKRINDPVELKNFITTKIHVYLAQEWDNSEKQIINWEDELLSLDIMTEKILDKCYMFDVDKILNNQGICMQHID